MNEEIFWECILKVHIEGLGDMDQKCVLIKALVSDLSAENAIEFRNIFDKQMDMAYSWDLWGAAYVIGGGCSDDAFNDFRSALISRGEASYKAATINPDSLADQIMDEDAFFYEGYQYAVSDGVENAVDAKVQRYAQHPQEPSGESWDEDDVVLKHRYPKLWAKQEGQYDSESMSYIDAEPPSIKSPAWFKPFVKLQIFGISLFIIVFVIYHFF